MRTFQLIGFVVIACFWSCHRQTDQGRLKQSLLESDRSFSMLSQKVGVNTAFLQTVDSACVLLKKNRRPVVGMQAIQSFYQQKDDSRYTLVWEPLSAEVAASGEMGFTYGIWELRAKGEDGAPQKGTYVSIWRRGHDQKWRLWLDTGNEGIGESVENK